MAVGETAQQLEQEQSNVSVVETARMALHVLGKVGVLWTWKLSAISIIGRTGKDRQSTHHIFEHKRQRFSRMDDIMECHNVGVFQFL